MLYSAEVDTLKLLTRIAYVGWEFLFEEVIANIGDHREAEQNLEEA